MLFSTLTLTFILQNQNYDIVRGRSLQSNLNMKKYKVKNLRYGYERGHFVFKSRRVIHDEEVFRMSLSHSCQAEGECRQQTESVQEDITLNKIQLMSTLML